MKIFTTLMLLSLGLSSLTGCGGGGGSGSGGGGTTPPTFGAPQPVVSYGLKHLQFSWPAVSGASYYRLFENPDGGSGYTQVGGDISGTSVSHPIALFRRVNASYIVAACDASACSDSAVLSITGALTASIGYFKASNTEASDWFGISAALSADGTTLVVGASKEDSSATGIGGNQADNQAIDSGAVYVYQLGAGGWSQQAYIKASNTGVDDAFGSSLALSADGNTLAVGAARESSGADGINGSQSDNSSPWSGAVYVFSCVAGQWSQQAYIKASNSGNVDFFGDRVALSAEGNTLVVGASGEASIATGINGNQLDNSMPGAGAAYVFTRSGGNWSQQAYIKASYVGDHAFGHAVALSSDGDTLAVGAYLEDSNATGIGGNPADGSALNSGAVYVFTRNVGQWSQQVYIKASTTVALDWFGAAVALSADGDTLAVGSYGKDTLTTSASGALYVFTRTAGVWSQQDLLRAPNPGTEDWLGISLTLSADGNLLAAGAMIEDSSAVGLNGNQNDETALSSGAVYLFTRSSGVWSQPTYIKASNTGSLDSFGREVPLSADGNTLAVGAPLEASAATGIGGNQADNSAISSGAVYLY